MPRQEKPARLYLRRRKGRAAQWVILDAGREFGTGSGEGDDRRAQDTFARYLAERRRPDTGQGDPSKIKIADVLMLYMRDVAPDTASPALIGYHASHLLEFFGTKSLGHINGALCRAYAGHRAQFVALSTVRRELVTFQAAINHWHRESPLAAVPRIVKPEAGQSRPHYLTRADAAKLLRAARRLGLPHIARFILIGLYTGTRHAALLALRWYPSADAGHIDVATCRLYRRGGTEAETRKRQPTARIPDRLMVHLRIWHRRDMEAGPQAAIIRWNGQPIIKERRAWARTVKEAGLGDEVTPHILRHSCATWALQSRMDPWDVAGLLGMSMQMLETVYGHHDPDYQDAAAGAFRIMGNHGRRSGTK